MTQNERWLEKYNEVISFIEAKKRNPSKHSDEERGRYLNWVKHNRIKGTGTFIHNKYL